MKIALNKVTKSFGTSFAINDFNLIIPDGKFVSFLGASGCGKTTVLRMISGLEIPDSGEIFFDDKCVFSSEKKINIPPEKRNLGFVFQDFALELTRKYIMENSRTAQNQDEYNAHYNALVERYEKLQKKSISLQKQKEERLAKRDWIGGFILELSKCKKLLTEFDEKLWVAAVDKVTVFQDGRLAFVFKDGTEIEA